MVYMFEFFKVEPDGDRLLVEITKHRAKTRDLADSYGESMMRNVAHDPTHEAGTLYLFDQSGRESAKGQLLEDIPRLISESGDVIGVGGFYESIYNATPAHTDDVHTAIFDNPDIEVITPAGGERRKANTISVNDILKIKTQRSFFPMFLNASKTK
jgi:hypothetical protein